MEKIFDNEDLDREHHALHEMAHILARKFKADLEETGCSYSYDGLVWQFDVWQENMESFKELIRQHCIRINEYREAEKNERSKE